MSNSVAHSLHPLERKVLPHIQSDSTLEELGDKSSLSEVETMRALQWLENKNLISIQKSEATQITLTVRGKEASEKGLPEQLLLDKLAQIGSIKFQELSEKTGLSKQEINLGLGVARSAQLIEITQGNISITDKGRENAQLGKELQDLLAKINAENAILSLDAFSEHEQKVISNTGLKRGLIEIKRITNRSASITKEGIEVKSELQLSNEVFEEKLTPQMLKDGSWKNTTLRPFDVQSTVPDKQFGKRHFVNESIDYIKQIWLDLGFKEMEGNLVQSAFWDLDALFVPQDHPARELQDTLYVDVKKAKLPAELYEEIKKAHQGKGKVKSLGWGEEFEQLVSEQVLLRTHTTVLSAQTLAALKEEDLPAKFFSVGKVFRNEALDWKHLFEFYQVEGIVIDPDASLAHLQGYLKSFYKKMGFTDVRMRPAHFPYTEPSMEIEAFHPVQKQWVELGGSGIFRPEFVVPLLGKDVPVLAWGMGMGRTIGSYFEITDIRDLYRNDIGILRNMKKFTR